MSGDLILTLNAGSSTVKLGVFEIGDNRLRSIASGIVDFRDAPFQIRLKHKGQKPAKLMTASLDDTDGLLREAFEWLGSHIDLSRLVVIAHRVVHGGDIFTGPAIITDEVLEHIDSLAQLAPLHQPESLRLIRATRRFYPDLVQTASFDTAFHNTNTDMARRFAIPRRLHDLGIKRYGFHGLSYRYIASKLGDLPHNAKVVVAHLGSGASLCAMEGGISRATSMGFSTLDGIPMATRSGSLDPGVLLHLLGSLGYTLRRAETLLYHESGLLGVSGVSADSRELLASPSRDAIEAIGLFCHRIAGEVARLATALRGIDALVFTAGIGENQPEIRAMVSEQLAWLGLVMDPKANAMNTRRVNAPESRVAILVIPTDEESILAEEAFDLRQGK